MTIEQAIEHAEEVSNKCQNFVTAHKEDRELGFVHRTEKCAEEHRQLAAWLRELQERRKGLGIVRCGECEHFRKEHDGEMWCGVSKGHGIDEDFFCGDAERRTDG